MAPSNYQIRPFSRNRQGVVEVMQLAEHRHIIHGLLEVDVTAARRSIHEHEARTGQHLSFTGFIIACLGKAVEQDRTVQAYRLGRDRLIVFDDVDVNVLIERVSPEGEKTVLAHVIRAANRKTYREINQEIQDVQTRRMETVIPRSTQRFTGLVMALPGFLRRIIFRIAMSNPKRWVAMGGTVAVSAVGMYGEGGGWGIPVTPNTLTVTLGGIARRPGVVEDRIEPREYLSVTVSFDHDVVDGAPAALFASRFKALIERAEDLLDGGGTV